MRIESYEFGRITVDGETYEQDVIIHPEGVRGSWWRREGHGLCREDLEPIFEHDPQVLIIGTGAQEAMDVPAEVANYMAERCEELHVEPTGRAVQRYNELSGGVRRVVAALHLTC
jgi:hypothetical protein